MNNNFTNITNALDDICDLIFNELSTKTYLSVVDLMTNIEENLDEIKSAVKEK